MIGQAKEYRHVRNERRMERAKLIVDQSGNVFEFVRGRQKGKGSMDSRDIC